MSTDLTFITNEGERNLLERFKVLIKSTKYFDALVGYFYTSGFHAMYKSLDDTEKIRILIGISTNTQVHDLIQQSVQEQRMFQFSHAEVKEEYSNLVTNEMEKTEDSSEVEAGVIKFLEWLKKGKLEIKAYPSQNIHAKLYIMTFAEDDRDVGRVITGSSNFTQSGLMDNLEFNVELKNSSDYKFSLEKFNELWQDAVDVKDKYTETIQGKTWLNNNITPYELYLKFLYEYFKDEISREAEMFFKYVPEKFMKLECQEQAVLNAKKILDEYGGAFISDVVGLGKTYMGTMLAGQLDGRTLVIAPPVLLERDNPGSWPNVFSDFRIHADYESIGKLEHLIRRGTGKYKNIIIDEAHRFRSESNATYEQLAQICRGKRIILVTATPFNNTPKDILSQIKLFQNSKKSTIPNIADLETFFSKLEKRMKNLDRARDKDKYVETAKANAREIRDKVLKYLMVRRTRTEIEKYFSEDLKKQGLKFPEVTDPNPVFYELNDDEDRTFDKTIQLIVKQFKYSRYTPMLYYEGKISQPEELAQKNMGKFMKILLIKRLESSFCAFKNSIGRFIDSYERFIKEFDKGDVYVSKKHTNKIFDLLEIGDEEAIQKLIEEDKAEKYDAKDFDKMYRKGLEDDLKVLIEIRNMWEKITRDPKVLKFVDILKKEKNLKSNKLIVFTESKETAEYLLRTLQKHFANNVLMFSGGSSALVREKVIENFDAKARFPKNDFRILITTEVLSEGVNLHRSNVVINYDIPWNPTRLMQRVGRINRVDTEFTKIHSFNFFPTRQGNTHIKLKEAAEAKIHAFITLLGSDARLLTDGEVIESHELFNRLVSKKTIIGEDEGEESELKYLHVIKEIRDNDPDLFNKIKYLPKKARTARRLKKGSNQLITYFRKGKLQKFFLADSSGSGELDFITVAKTLEAKSNSIKEKIGQDFYSLLEKNKEAFLFSTMKEVPEVKKKGGRDAATHILKIVKAIKDLRQLTDEQETYLKCVIDKVEAGGLPKQTLKKTLQAMEKELKNGPNAIKLVAQLQKNIPNDLLESHIAESSAKSFGPREVILSEYFKG